MNVLVLMGSPRKKGNTAAMVEAFKQGAEGAGHEVVVADVASMNIKGCLGCEYCHTKGGGACIQQDDMQKVYPELAKADVLIIATPVYYWTMTAQMHCAFQRFYAPGMNINFKKAAMLISSGSDGVYDAIDSQLASSFGYLGVEIIDSIKAYGELNSSEEILDKCRALGANL